MKPIWYKPIFFFFLKKCFNLFDTCRVRVFACWTRRFFLLHFILWFVSNKKNHWLRWLVPSTGFRFVNISIFFSKQKFSSHKTLCGMERFHLPKQHQPFWLETNTVLPLVSFLFWMWTVRLVWQFFILALSLLLPLLFERLNFFLIPPKKTFKNRIRTHTPLDL